MKTRPTFRSPSLLRAVADCVLVAPLLLGASLQAQAQTPALTPATSQTAPQAQVQAAQPASAASAARPERRHLTPDEKRESATAPGELRPSDPVVPQLRIPLSRNVGDVATAASSAGSIDDDAARCRAQASAADRARCGAGAQKIIVAKPAARP